jgi:hypothetical protein
MNVTGDGKQADPLERDGRGAAANATADLTARQS